MIPTFKLQQLLRLLYDENKQKDTILQLHLIELGWAVKRLLDKEEINPFDNSDLVMKKALNEMDWNKLNKEIKDRGLI